MKYLWPVAALLCADVAYAGTLYGNYIGRPDRPDCNPYAAQAVPDQWPLEVASPRHCATVGTINPVFTWTRRKGLWSDAGKMALFELRNEAGDLIYSVSTPDTRLILPKSLTRYSMDRNAVYYWTVTYREDAVNIWKSAPRQFIVDDGYSVPLANDIVLTAKSRPHPRAVARKVLSDGRYESVYDSYARVTGAITNGTRSAELTAAFGKTEIEADRFVSEALINGAPYQRYTPSAKHSPDTLAQGTIRERRAIEILGHMYFLTYKNNPAKANTYLTECRDRLVALAKWPLDPTSPTYQANNDQTNRDAMLGLALGWDIFQAPEAAGIDATLKPTADELTEIRRVAMDRINNAIDGAGDKAGFNSLRTAPFNSHVISAAHYATEALLYLVRPEDSVVDVNEGKDAGSRLAKSWNTLLTSVGTWGGTSDGGFGNGSNYAWYSTVKNARTLAAVKLVTGKDLTDFTPIGDIGMNIVAQTPPADGATFHNQMGTFGDGAEINDHFKDYAGNDFRLLAYATKKPVYEWYWRTHAPFVDGGKPLQPYAFLLFGACDETDPAARCAVSAESPVADSFLFEDAGYVAFHSNTAKPDRTSLYFRSSPQGTASHGEADNNAFVFVSQGEDVLINSGFYGNWDNPHFKTWTRHTMAKNALTLQNDGRSGFGQAQHFKDGQFQGAIYESPDAKGKLVNYYAGTGTDRWRIATGDATAAYRYYDETAKAWKPLVDSAIRSVAYLKGASESDPGVVFVYDYAHSEQARLWELNFHSLTQPVINGNRITITTKNRTTGALFNTCIDYYGPAGRFENITETSPGTDIPAPLDSKYVVPQWHTRFKQYTASPSKYFYALTVIREQCPADANAPNPVTVPTPADARIEASVGGKGIVFNQGRVDFH
jgi:hypothetical protein